VKMYITIILVSYLNYSYIHLHIYSSGLIIVEGFLGELGKKSME
jgi:hypothetical protein